MRYLIIACLFPVMLISCHPFKEIRETRTDTLVRHVLVTDTVLVDNENMLRELDRAYFYSDSLYNELLICNVNSHVQDAPLIYVAPRGKLKVGKAKDLQVSVAYKSIIDSLRMDNARKEKCINKYKNELSGCSEQQTGVVNRVDWFASRVKKFSCVAAFIVVFCVGVFCGIKARKFSEYML